MTPDTSPRIKDQKSVMNTFFFAALATCLLSNQSLAFNAAVPTSRTWVSTSGRPRAPVLRARRKGDLFQEIAELETDAPTEGTVDYEKPAGAEYDPSMKEKAILAPEETFFEGPPSPSELVVPAISILTVLGIVPFIATVTRQFWVKYKITSRRISVTSGFNGQDLTEITYDEIYSMKFVYRNWGQDGDLVIELRDGARLEMRSVPDFDNIYNYILEKCDSEVQEYSDKTRANVGKDL